MRRLTKNVPDLLLCDSSTETVPTSSQNGKVEVNSAYGGSRFVSPLRELVCYMGSHSYLPPERGGDVLAITQAKVGMNGRVDLKPVGANILFKDNAR